ncbi:MAG: 30S ribosomal protein S7 [Anaeroplasma sp.]
MPRKGHIAKRDVLPDPIYNSKVVTRTINAIMLDGKKGTAQTILYSAFDRIQNQTGQDPLEVFNKALENISPVVEVKSRRIGGQNYQVPVEVRPERKQTLALRWLIKYSRLRNDKTMDEKLAKEIMDAANGLGGACKKREEVHKMAEANKAFAHYRW